MEISKLVTVYNYSGINDTRPLRVELTTFLQEGAEFQRIAKETLSLSKAEALEVIKKLQIEMLQIELDNQSE